MTAEKSFPKIAKTSIGRIKRKATILLIVSLAQRCETQKPTGLTMIETRKRFVERQRNTETPTRKPLEREDNRTIIETRKEFSSINQNTGLLRVLRYE